VTCQRSSGIGNARGICVKIDNKRLESYCSPHNKTLDKSFPVPNGQILTGGLFNDGYNSAKQPKTHPTVPSPPKTQIRIFCNDA
jgi:hypothetical protein